MKGQWFQDSCSVFRCRAANLPEENFIRRHNLISLGPTIRCQANQDFISSRFCSTNYQEQFIIMRRILEKKGPKVRNNGVRILGPDWRYQGANQGIGGPRGQEGEDAGDTLAIPGTNTYPGGARSGPPRSLNFPWPIGLLLVSLLAPSPPNPSKAPSSPQGLDIGRSAPPVHKENCQWVERQRLVLGPAMDVLPMRRILFRHN